MIRTDGQIAQPKIIKNALDVKIKSIAQYCDGVVFIPAEINEILEMGIDLLLIAELGHLLSGNASQLALLDEVQFRCNFPCLVIFIGDYPVRADEPFKKFIPHIIQRNGPIEVCKYLKCRVIISHAPVLHLLKIASTETGRH